MDYFLKVNSQNQNLPWIQKSQSECHLEKLQDLYKRIIKGRESEKEFQSQNNIWEYPEQRSMSVSDMYRKPKNKFKRIKSRIVLARAIGNEYSRRNIENITAFLNVNSSKIATTPW